MPEPYRVLSCSWPQPVVRDGDRWISEPDWDAPLFPATPQTRWASVENALCWTIDWREFFDAGLRRWTSTRGGEMRNFYVVFRIRIATTGRLAVWDDDGSVIRREGRIVHDDRTMHPPRRYEIEARAGEVLEIAQWQAHGEWLWGAHTAEAQFPKTERPMDVFEPFVRAARTRMEKPDSPALKIYCNGNSPIRTALCALSLVLNGGAPREVILFGEHQWSAHGRALLGALLPFARVVATDRFVESLGSAQLGAWAREHWFVMKACAALLHPPFESCLMDDDVFVLEPVADALAAFGQCNFVYSQDMDHSKRYYPVWGRVFETPERLPTGAFNAGLYWLRVSASHSDIVGAMLQVNPRGMMPMDWEQGLIAHLHAKERALALPGQRYFYPYYDGLPGGILGYDYRRNPCGFASVHFGGLAEKPSEFDSLLLAPAILGRHERLRDL